MGADGLALALEEAAAMEPEEDGDVAWVGWEVEF